MMSLIPRALVTLCALAGVASAVSSVKVQGQNFVNTNSGNRLMVLGVDYQPGGQSGYKPDTHQDPLTNGTVCLRDAAVLQHLGVNTIRVYNLDPTANHDDCVSIFNAAGIYLILDVNSPLDGESLNRADPVGSYHATYMSRVFSMVEAFKNYPNVIGFFGSNEVINDVTTSEANPPYIRAVIRDLKNYIAKHASRSFPVGYSAADVREILADTHAYVQCAINGDDSDPSRADFFGLNSYSWCGGDATFDTSGYDDLVTMFEGSSIPVFFSEYGCNKVQPRVFDEVQALYGKQMTSLSGGLVYEYSQETSDYGLVQINGNGTATLLVDFDNLQGQFNKLDISLLEAADPAAINISPPKCTKSLIASTTFNTSFSLPNTPDDVQSLIDDGLDNPNQGKLVEVKETVVPMPVYATNGNIVQGLAITVVSDVNTPSGENTTAEATSTASAPNPTKSAASPRLGMSYAFVVLLFAAILLL